MGLENELMVTSRYGLTNITNRIQQYGKVTELAMTLLRRNCAGIEARDQVVCRNCHSGKSQPG
jgi:hypothetical protein